MMIRRFTVAVLLAMSMNLTPHNASGSGSGVTNIGSFIIGGGDATGSREWIELVGSSGLLSGRPRNKSIQLITIYAPGCDQGHLILRELESSNGSKSLLLSGPASLLNKGVRTTIYLKDHSQNSAFFEYSKGIWRKRIPQSFHVISESDSGNSKDFLLAFPVESPGLYYLTEKDISFQTTDSGVLKVASADSLLGGCFFRGVLPLILAFLVLILGWISSYSLHRIEQNVGN